MAILDVHSAGTVLQSKRAKFFILSLWEDTTRTVYGRAQQGRFMEEDSKHLYSFVGSHMLSHDLDVSLWLHFAN